MTVSFSNSEPPGDTSPQSERICLAALLALSLLAIFFQIGNRSFENQGYIRYAEVARQMVHSGDWIVPRLRGELYLDKPILLIWLIALPSALVGNVTPLLARIPSALSAMGGIALTFYLGKRMFRDYRVGAIAGLILLSSQEYFWQSRTARTDMLLTFFILASLTSFYVAYEASGQKRFRFFILFFASMSLATLTKGPPGILFPLGTSVLFLFIKKKLRVLLEPGFWWGGVVFVGILCPWLFLYFTRVSPTTFIDTFNVEAILTRPEPLYYYLIEFWPRFSPWSLFLPAGIIFMCRKNPALKEAKLFCLCCLGVILAVIFPMHNKSYRYLLPAFPVFSLILAATWKEASLYKEITKERLASCWKASASILFAIFTVSSLAAPFICWWYTRSPTGTLVCIFDLIVGGSLLGYMHFRGKATARVVVIGLSALLIYETYFFFIAQEDEKHSPGRQMAAAVQSLISKEGLRIFDFDKVTYLDLYLDTIVPELKSPSEVIRYLSENSEPRACLMSKKGYDLIHPQVSQEPWAVHHIPYRKETYFLVIRAGEHP